MGGAIPALMFAALFALILLGIPVSLALIVTSFGFGYLFFGDAIALQFWGKILEATSSFALAAVPLFIFMGSVLEKSGIAERLLAALQIWLGRLPGGLAVAAMVMGGIFAAATGIIGAVEVVIGLMAIPIMLRAGYDRGLISGTITSAGSLGTIIPPSILCVVYGSVGQLSIADLFAGCLVPGLVMVGQFVLYILVRCLLYPADGPPSPQGVGMTLGAKLALTFRAILPAVTLIVAVLGSILAGIASPTEAAGIGAFGSVALAAINRRLSLALMGEALGKTLQLTAMIMLIVLGGTMFSSVFYVHGGGAMVTGIVRTFELGPWGMVALFIAIVFAAGFVLDWATIVLICVPIFTPLVKAAAIDPLWFAILAIVTLQASYLTPPMAPAIFYLRSIAPREITYGDMYRGVVPFILCQIVTLVLVALFPALATWLPRALH